MFKFKLIKVFFIKNGPIHFENLPLLGKIIVVKRNQTDMLLDRASPLEMTLFRDKDSEYLLIIKRYHILRHRLYLSCLNLVLKI